MRFDRQDLLWSAGLLVLVMLCYVFLKYLVDPLSLSWPQWVRGTLITILAIALMAAAGAAAGAPFKKKAVGAFIGTAIVLLFFLLILLPGRSR
jgi:hypothetical protein